MPEIEGLFTRAGGGFLFLLPGPQWRSFWHLAHATAIRRSLGDAFHV
jgi:hypothetical protein